MSTAQASPGDTSLRSRYLRVVSAVHRLDPGDLADLRRLRPDDLGRPAFWKLVADVLEPAELLPRGGPTRDAAETRWAASLSAIARLKGLNQAKRSLGAALAAARYAELRFVRLLRAEGPGLWDTVRTTSHYLASKAEGSNLADLVELVESDGHPKWAEATRRRLARDYYRHLGA